MDIYILLFVLLFCLCFVRKNIYCYIVVYFILFFIGSLRGIDVGTDTAHYEERYRIINSGADELEYILGFVEPGWVFINYWCGQIFNDYRSTLYISMFLALTPLFLRSWKICDNPFHVLFFYVALYFYYNTFNITRQLIAISIIIFIYPFLEKGYIKKFSLGVLIAMLFHYSAIICLFYPIIIKKVNINVVNSATILMVSYICGLYILPQLLPSLPFFGRYSVYLMDGVGSGSITRILLNVFFIFIIATSKKHKVNNYLKLFFVGIVSYNLFAFSSAVGRVSLYFTCMQLLLFANIDSSFSLNRCVLKLFVFLYATIYYFTMLNANSCEIVPYKLWE